MSIVEPALNISAVERETDLSEDVLRKWETPYSFPTPLRDANGERIYAAEQVSRLRLVKRLMDAGFRRNPHPHRRDDEEKLADPAQKR